MVEATIIQQVSNNTFEVYCGSYDVLSQLVDFSSYYVVCGSEDDERDLKRKALKLFEADLKNRQK